jgi:hypothetical protein
MKFDRTLNKLQAEIFKSKNINKNDFQCIYNNYKKYLKHINLDLALEYTKNLEFFNFQSYSYSDHLMILRGIEENQSFQLSQILTHSPWIKIYGVKHLCHELSPTGLILYKHILNFNNHIKKKSYFF